MKIELNATQFFLKYLKFSIDVTGDTMLHENAFFLNQSNMKVLLDETKSVGWKFLLKLTFIQHDFSSSNMVFYFSANFESVKTDQTFHLTYDN